MLIHLLVSAIMSMAVRGPDHGGSARGSPGLSSYAAQFDRYTALLAAGAAPVHASGGVAVASPAAAAAAAGASPVVAAARAGCRTLHGDSAPLPPPPGAVGAAPVEDEGGVSGSDEDGSSDDGRGDQEDSGGEDGESGGVDAPGTLDGPDAPWRAASKAFQVPCASVGI